MKTNDINLYNWQYLRLFFALLVVLIGSSTASHGQGTNTVLVANFMNGNDAALNSRVYLWNPSASAGAVTVRVFTLPLRGGTAQELTTTPLDLGILGARSALNIKLAEDILTPLGITPPYTTDGGNLTVEFMIQTPDVRGAAQVFSSDFAFGTYPLQVVPSAPPLVITSLSTTSAAPLKTLNITGSGFDSTADLSVRFSDDQEFTVDIPVVDASATSVTVAVPPFVDVVTGAFASGTVSVQVVQSTGTGTRTSNAVPGFEIQTLLSPTATPGYVSIAVLEAIEVFLPVIRDTLLGLSGTAATDVLSALDDYEASVDDLRNSIITVIQNPSQSVSIGSFDGTSLVLNTATLVELDRVMANFLVTFLPNSPGKCTNDPTANQLLIAAGAVQEQRDDATEFYQTCLQVGLTESVESLERLTKAIGTGLLTVSAGCFFYTGGLCAVPAAIGSVVGGTLVIQSNAIAVQLLMTQKMVSKDGTLTDAQRESLRQSLTGMLEGIYVPFITLGLDKIQKGAGLVASLLLAYQNLQNKITTLVETTVVDVIVPPPAGSLEVSPATGLSMMGNVGGPFTPPSQNYTLTNTGGTAISYTISKNANWVSLASTGGSLEPEASTSVLVAINSNAVSLAVGPYSDTVAFTNTTNSNGNTSRPVELTVNAVEPPPPPPDEVSITVETGICIVERFSWGDIISLTVETSGSVSGPVGTDFSAAGLSDLSCSIWSNCERTGAEPSTTGWTYSGYGIRGLNTMYYYAGTESFSTTVTCPLN